MRSLWLLAEAIGAAVLIFAHASLVGVVIGVPFLRTCRRLAFEAVWTQKRARLVVDSRAQPTSSGSPAACADGPRG
jgi:hypothetical protein